MSTPKSASKTHLQQKDRRDVWTQPISVVLGAPRKADRRDVWTALLEDILKRNPL